MHLNLVLKVKKKIENENPKLEMMEVRL